MEIKIVVEGEGREYFLGSQDPISFAEAMERVGLNFCRPCNGQGRCFNCGVRFAYGNPEITSLDEKAFEFDELADGWRLGCQCIIRDNARIEVPKKLLSDIVSPEAEVKNTEAEDTQAEEDGLIVAIDAGTTTLSVAIVSKEKKEIIASGNVTNNQRKFGADVVSRIDAALNGHEEELTELIRSDALRGAWALLKDKRNVERVVFSGNTVMTHLALDYPVDGLAQYPFRPYCLSGKTSVKMDRTVYNMPCASAFIGGDIVAGIYQLEMTKSPEKSLLVDLGTNAEIVLWTGEKLIAASAAAGPALEAGNIKKGCASVPGAINHVKIEDGRCQCTTIGGAPSIGICGSGVIDAVYAFYKNGIIDNGGLFTKEFSTEGYDLTPSVTFTPEDVQQVLLAKSAIYSAITVLLQKAGLSSSDIDHLYVAGGLGVSVEKASVFGIGILPEELKDKFEAVGNTSLLGTVKLALSEDTAEVEKIAESIEVVELSLESQFEKLYLENLFLPA